MSKAKAMTKTEVEKQVKAGENVVRKIIQRNLEKEGFKVKPKTFVLSGRHFVKSVGAKSYNTFTMEYTVGVTNKMPGLSIIEVGGDFAFRIDGLEKGDKIFTKNKMNVPVTSGFEVLPTFAGYHERDDWK